jgi:hypothetical protein
MKKTNCHIQAAASDAQIAKLLSKELPAGCHKVGLVYDELIVECDSDKERTALIAQLLGEEER